MRGIVLVLGMSGCLTERGYVEPLVDVYCSRLEECDKGQFDVEYGSRASCVDSERVRWDRARDCAMDAECDFVHSQAADCRHELVVSNCENFVEFDWISDCDRIYDCTSSAGPAPRDCAIVWPD